jgi:cytochrome c peroxidase
MKKVVFWCIMLLIWGACSDENNEADSLEHIPYAPKSYQLVVPKGWHTPEIPADNPLTEEGIELGRRLFYDPILSVDSTISCASCHNLQGAFTDNAPVSIGVKGRIGKRSSMSLVNMVFMNKGLFWDGRSQTLEAQALLPVEDHLEMAENWPVAEQKLRRHKDYPSYFRKAFGIDKKSEITKELAAKAIAQFERSIISKDSKYDKVLQEVPGYSFTDDEEAGYIMFFNTKSSYPDAQCGHCHSGSLVTTNQYLNNGLQEANEYEDFLDKGQGAVTNDKFDNGKFRVPTLRNISFTAPYMHNGSIKTIEDMMKHYISGGKYSPNKDPLIQQIKLNPIQKQQVIEFLKTFDDTTFINNPAYKNPFR